MGKPICTVDGCVKPVRSSNAVLCGLGADCLIQHQGD